jgi:murein DD-endopeptidase MepM/ murein hydrolase activator NlpD
MWSSSDLYSMSGHLVPGSVRVKAGARVRRGQVLGACGNSGNSSEPHLHFQLQDGPTMRKSFGIEPVFQSVEVTRDGKRARVTDYTWRKGDRVHAP